MLYHHPLWLGVKETLIQRDANIQNYYILNTDRNSAVAGYTCCGENIYLAHILSGYGDKRGRANGWELLLNTKGRKLGQNQ